MQDKYLLKKKHKKKKRFYNLFVIIMCNTDIQSETTAYKTNVIRNEY